MRYSNTGNVSAKAERSEDMEQYDEQNIDIIIVGTGAAGLFCALQFPKDTKIPFTLNFLK